MATNRPMMIATIIPNILVNLESKNKPFSHIHTITFMYLRIAILLIINMFLVRVQAQEDITYFLPDISYNPAIPTPESVIGHQVGEWHISHDKIIHYLEKLAASSDRVIYREYARSHEQRPLINLIISSPANIANIDKIQAEHLKLSDPAKSDNVNTADQPIVVYQGYSIHGNESSGVNAAMLVAYYLAAGQSAEVLNTLENGVFIIDPAYNPDGVNRFASWVNSHKNEKITSDPADREYTEAFPRGRTNHYWFDLNRDWLLLTHPESQGRINAFHNWKPNILTDHHEMGTNSTFFFQPGIPSRTNPNTPQKNQDLTGEIGTYHAVALDSIKSLYYTKASFDDYYYGKGSTYPDANGCVGILFEQASSRGHSQESDNGILTFPFTIRNQVVTSLSTQKAAISMRKKMLDYQREFYKQNKKDGENSRIGGWLYTDQDKAKLNRYNEIMLAHRLEVYPVSADMMHAGKKYPAGESYYVPMAQTQSKMAKTIFEKVRSFPDSLFYDVSAWTMPLAFDLQYDELSKANTGKLKLGDALKKVQPYAGKLYDSQRAYAYIIPWNQYKAANSLLVLQDAGLITKVAHQPVKTRYTVEGDMRKMIELGRGAIIVPLQNQSLSHDEIRKLLSKLAMENQHDIYALNSGTTDTDFTLGHPDATSIKKPEAAVIVGTSTSSYDVGELWYTMDQRLGYPITKLPVERVSKSSLKKYNTLLMGHGWYSALDSGQVDAIKDWVSQGNTLITTRGATDWAVNNNIIQLKRHSAARPEDHEYHAYCNHSKRFGARYIGGAILNTQLDLSHPLNYGYDDDMLPIFKRGTQLYDAPSNNYATPMRYTQRPVLSGYIPYDYEPQASNRPSLTVHSKGSGRVIAFQDNPNFRGYWYGGTRQFYNAVFFGSTIDRGTMAR